MWLLQLAEELYGIVDPINPKLECGDIVAVDADLDLFAWKICALAGD
jgi:hypothetical protein